jgi:hypothetical protein
MFPLHRYFRSKETEALEAAQLVFVLLLEPNRGDSIASQIHQIGNLGNLLSHAAF